MGCDLAVDELEPESATAGGVMGDGLTGGEADAMDVGVLVNGC